MSQRDLMGDPLRSQLLIFAACRESFTPTVDREPQRRCNSPAGGDGRCGQMCRVCAMILIETRYVLNIPQHFSCSCDISREKSPLVMQVNKG
jgi:hypothetical protein